MSSLIDTGYLVRNLLLRDFPRLVRVTDKIGHHCVLINLDQVWNFEHNSWICKANSIHLN